VKDKLAFHENNEYVKRAIKDKSTLQMIIANINDIAKEEDDDYKF
jgi:hypothetical protein